MPGKQAPLSRLGKPTQLFSSGLKACMDTIQVEHAMVALQKGIPFLRSGANGEIFDVNEAFEDLTGYSAFELKKKGWRLLSVQNEDLEADFAVTAELVAGNRQSITIIKSYVSKLGVPIPGQLLLIRYPQGKDMMECALCFFMPLANGSKAALSLVVDYIEKHTNASHAMAEKIATMSQDLQARKTLTVGERLWDTFGEWAMQNPKIAIVALFVLLTLNPLPIIQTYITRMGWLPAQPVQLEIQDKQGSTRPASKSDLKALGIIDEAITQQIGDLVVAKTITVETPSGRTVSWHGGSGPVSTSGRRIGWGAVRYRGSSEFAGREDRGIRGVSIDSPGSESTVSY